ncbi:HipA domain-containing protein [Diaphorobacter caeni]|uniref:HipA domain-containing protein n=1 Tax=Diaphorobacter caeni TaxID=2784387 RepID=UPI00188EE496|nr:HipA domain-containing protein [Diaphorobacter caeni]MBF5007377.1 HipA domain-containing protein [Diaphorobacter caeni]
MTEANASALGIWCGGERVGSIQFDHGDERWGLQYSPTWLANGAAFPLSPQLPLQTPPEGHGSSAVRRFLQNLLPEGPQLDDIARACGLSKANVYGLVQALGAETTGAFRFLPIDATGDEAVDQPAREVSLAELSERIRHRQWQPFANWDGRLRLSVAGQQDKLALHVQRGAADHAGDMRLVLPDAPYTSTHLLKPESQDPKIPFLVANEHFCMRLAARMGQDKGLQFEVARVDIIRVPEPVLFIERFDRMRSDASPLVQRLHIIDGCQALDFPVASKYELNTGPNRLYRDGMSLPRLFSASGHAQQPARTRLMLLRWSLFQLLLGNYDAHGKNFSFYVHADGLAPCPWYDLLSVAMYPSIANEYAMAFGDAFADAELTAYELAHFAQLCGIAPALLKKEAQKLASAARQYAPELARAEIYNEDERAFVSRIADHVDGQARWLFDLAGEASRFKAGDF